MKIGLIGKFRKLHDEEYIAQSFESLGNDVIRIEHGEQYTGDLDLLIIGKCKDIPKGYKTVSWLFDLYYDYHREHLVKTAPYFKTEIVFTTDGGHSKRWKEDGINHICVRQGIFKDECFMGMLQQSEYDVVFVGSDNPIYPERTIIMRKLANRYKFCWFGKRNTEEIRGRMLNQLYARSKIVVGDSYPSPHYWSNRVVETLGRGGFLIHRYVEGIKEEYPDLVTYDGTDKDLYEKIDYFLSHDEEREVIRRKNFELVKNNYTMDKKCKEILNYVTQLK